MKSNHLVPSSLLICTILLFMSCSENSVTDDVNTLISKHIAKQIAGQYESTVFTDISPDDGGVNILARGGMITIRLFDNFEVEGHLLIPDDSGIPITPTDEDFKGIFILNEDRLHFNNTGTFLDYEWWFLVTENKLETPEWDGWRGQSKIILEKQ